MPALVVADQQEIEGAGIEALLQAGGLNVITRCSHEDELLRFVEAHRPDIILLAENIVGQEAAKTLLRLRGRNCSVVIIFVLKERGAITAADLLDFDVEWILLSAAGARSVIDCIESVRHGRKWVDPTLLGHLAVAERPSQVGGSLTPREAEIARLVIARSAQQGNRPRNPFVRRHREDALASYLRQASPRRQNAACAVDDRNMRADAGIGR